LLNVIEQELAAPGDSIAGVQLKPVIKTFATSEIGTPVELPLSAAVIQAD